MRRQPWGTQRLGGAVWCADCISAKLLPSSKITVRRGSLEMDGSKRQGLVTGGPPRTSAEPRRPQPLPSGPPRRHRRTATSPPPPGAVATSAPPVGTTQQLIFGKPKESPTPATPRHSSARMPPVVARPPDDPACTPSPAGPHGVPGAQRSPLGGYPHPAPGPQASFTPCSCSAKGTIGTSLLLIPSLEEGGGMIKPSV